MKKSAHIKKMDIQDRSDLSVSCILVNESKQILFQLRDDKPDIPYPSHWAFVSGWVMEGETLVQAVEREIQEEIVDDLGLGVKLLSSAHLGSFLRRDNWYEHVFLCEIEDKTLYKAIEGQEIRQINPTDVLKMQPFAGHHRDYFVKYKKGLDKYIKTNKWSDFMENLNKYVSVLDISTAKDYDQLEGGLGFVIDTGLYGTCAITPAESAQFVALLEFKAGKPRGNHYHEKKVEYMVALNGKLKCELYPIDQSFEKLTLILEPGKILKILPGCVHTFTAQDNDVFALEYSPQKFEKSDVIVV